jgi:thiamine biosynthesis lipoprotein
MSDMQHSDTQQRPTSGLRGLTRRRAVRIVAAAAGLPLMIAAVRATAPAGRLFDWQGEVLGAFAELSLWHTDEAAARRAIRQVEGEIARYERIFGLARADSEITRLNAAGALTGPSPELRGLMEESRRFSVLSAGAFDISVQPLWRLYEAHFWSRSAVQDDVLARARDVARDLVDYRAIDIGAARIAFARPGMAVTLNSLAQGFVTDACADLLRNEGFATAFVDLGEVRALGRHPDGRPWRVGIRNPQAAGLMQANPGRADSAQTDSVQAGLVQAGPVRSGVAQTLDLEDTAMAVSGGYGTTFEPTGRFHHIFDPHTGESAHALLDATVVGPRATVANGLSTALCVTGEERAAALIAGCPGYRAILTRPDGTTVGFGATAA